jgi:DNA-binding NarL/FixJ family response regulator
MQKKRDKGGMIRLLLVDDQPSVRQGLRMRLSVEPDITVVGEASNGREAMALVQQLAPDIVLMDVEMPEMDGIEAAAVMCASTPQSAIVMLSIHDDVSTRARAHAAGAAAFVTKSGAIEVLLATIRQTAEQRKTETGSL